MYRAHQIRLYPNKEQEQFLLQSCGIARFSYNWALAKWKEQYESGLKVNEGKLRKELNSIKRDEYPWMMEVSKCVPQSAIKNLGKAFDNFFRNVKQGKKPGYPKFKKKGISQDSFTLDYLSFQLDGRYLRIAKMMKCPIRMAESLRYPECKPLSITIKRIADRWFASIRVELDDIDTVHENQGTSIGVDLGITCAVTFSDGRKIFAPKPLEKMLRKLKRLSRSLSRKQKGSKNRNKARIKLARLPIGERDRPLHRIPPTPLQSRRNQCVKGGTRPVSLCRYFACCWGVGPRTHRSDSSNYCLSAVGIPFLKEGEDVNNW